jgi:high-affinity iron transporter
MLATLVIGLREGLEAALIVGIIAAFLRRAGKPLRPMWIGVVGAVVLSIAVGVVLQVISADLPQAQQEGMETIIGLIAVAFVTGMIGWMNQHARNLRKDLEHSAQDALRDGTAWALVGMAFLAVLKEGFETSVFLLAAFQSSTSSFAAAAGAVLGIAIAVGIGVGIYRGGVKLNLARFFRITGFFLVLVAAGLVLSALRTAHEAGWITIGQQTTVNLGWLAPNGSIQAALLTGVLGIPADPRLIEVLGWVAYLVPVLLYLLWPIAKRPSATQLPKLMFGLATAFLVSAIVLVTAVPLPASYTAGPAALTGDGASVGSATLSKSAGTYALTTTVKGTTIRRSFAASATTADPHDGLDARVWRNTTTDESSPTSITLPELIALSGGRVPIGMTASQNPGPFSIVRESRSVLTVWVAGNALLDASSRVVTIATLSGGGLTSTRTLSVASAADAPSWVASSSYVSRTTNALSSTATQISELLLWKVYLPLVLALAALILGLNGLRDRRRFRFRPVPVDADKPAATHATSAPARV